MRQHWHFGPRSVRIGWAVAVTFGLGLAGARDARAQPGYLGFGSPYFGSFGGAYGSGFGIPYVYGFNYAFGAPPGQFGGTPARPVSWGAAGYYNSAYSIYGAPGPPLPSGTFTPIGYGGPAGYGAPVIWIPGTGSRRVAGPGPGFGYGYGYGNGYGYPPPPSPWAAPPPLFLGQPRPYVGRVPAFR